MALILDTGPLYASLDRSDADHVACRRLIESAEEPLVIPAPVLVEVDYWVGQRLSAGALVALLDDIDLGAYRVEALTTDDYQRMLEQGSKPPIAKLTVARKIAAVVLVMWKNKEGYDPDKDRNKE